MYLGIYEFAGEPRELVAAYDRLMASLPESMLLLHACTVNDGGITVYDACPTREAFERFSTGADFRRALEAAGLPAPVVSGFEVHAARGPGGATIS